MTHRKDNEIDNATSHHVTTTEVELVEESSSPPRAEGQPAPGSFEELIEKEEIIEAEGPAFVRVGLAIAAIRTNKLYVHRGYETFEDYCKGYLGYDPSHASRLCCQAQLAIEMKDRTDEALKQAHVRALLPGVKRRKNKEPDYSVALRAYEETKRETDGAMTARDLAAKVRQINGDIAAQKPKGPKKDAVAEDLDSDEASVTAPEESNERREESSPKEDESVEKRDEEEPATSLQSPADTNEFWTELIACNGFLVTALKDVKCPGQKITPGRFESLWKSYQHLDIALRCLDASHEADLNVPEGL